MTRTRESGTRPSGEGAEAEGGGAARGGGAAEAGGGGGGGRRRRGGERVGDGEGSTGAGAGASARGGGAATSYPGRRAEERRGVAAAKSSTSRGDEPAGRQRAERRPTQARSLRLRQGAVHAAAASRAALTDTPSRGLDDAERRREAGRPVDRVASQRSQRGGTKDAQGSVGRAAGRGGAKRRDQEAAAAESLRRLGGGWRRSKQSARATSRRRTARPRRAATRDTCAAVWRQPRPRCEDAPTRRAARATRLSAACLAGSASRRD